MLGGVNLVEIDLLRGGERMPMLEPWPESAYAILVGRANEHNRCRVWPVALRQRLPLIPVPLARPDPDIMLDIQPMIGTIYKRSRYAQSIDYARPADPPLPPDDAAWLTKRLRARRGG